MNLLGSIVHYHPLGGGDPRAALVVNHRQRNGTDVATLLIWDKDARETIMYDMERSEDGKAGTWQLRQKGK